MSHGDDIAAHQLGPAPGPLGGPVTIDGWVLRPALAEDREIARSIHHAAYEDVVTRQFGGWDLAAQDRFFEDGWDGHKNSLIVVDGQPCGYCTIECRADDTHVRELVIHPGSQGRGIGTAILRTAMDAAAERGVPVVLGALHENRARLLYERLGFITFDSTVTHVLMRWHPGHEIEP